MSHYILSQFDGTYGNKEEVNMATDFILRVKTMYELRTSQVLSSHQRICDVLQKQSERQNKEKEDI